jgi:hypothetical protein
MTIAFSRCFAMPSAETFGIRPIGEFVKRYLAESKVSVDPFARNRDWTTHTNDINRNTTASAHMDAEEFLIYLDDHGVIADLVLFDPPYSPRQVSEHYKAAGREVTAEDTQNGRLYKRVRDAIDRIVRPGGVVLSFGWQSMGMGIGRSYIPLEILLVPHGGGHNDTICLAERKSALTVPSQHSGGGA